MVEFTAWLIVRRSCVLCVCTSSYYANNNY